MWDSHGSARPHTIGCIVKAMRRFIVVVAVVLLGAQVAVTAAGMLPVATGSLTTPPGAGSEQDCRCVHGTNEQCPMHHRGTGTGSGAGMGADAGAGADAGTSMSAGPTHANAARPGAAPASGPRWCVGCEEPDASLAPPFLLDPGLTAAAVHLPQPVVFGRLTRARTAHVADPLLVLDSPPPRH